MKYISVLALAMSLAAVPSPARGQDSLERGLLRQAPALIRKFQEKGYRNVGVLKFLAAREGEGKLSDRVGTINLLAARRLELALILANDPIKPVGIIENASEIAHKIPGVSHLRKDARAKFFTQRYPLAWGSAQVEPDAFVTGVTVVSKDLRFLTVTLLSFDRAGNQLEKLVDDFQVLNSGDRLTEVGESFVLRGAFDDGAAEVVQAKKEAQVFQQAVHVRQENVKHPAQEHDVPVLLSVYYDGKQVPLEFKNGQAHIPEPQEGQKIEFGLARDRSKVRYGVVLKVNGENTLDKQRLPDIGCRRWVLEPGHGPWTIGGYHLGNEVREKFRVASVAESKELEFHYGHDVGTITMSVFRELRGKPPVKLLQDQEQYEPVLKQLTQLSEKPKNHGALLAQLLESANRDTSRGVIAPGQQEASRVQVVGFTADPTPIMCVTINYYRK